MDGLRGWTALAIWTVGAIGCGTVEKGATDPDAGRGADVDAAGDPDVDAAPDRLDAGPDAAGGAVSYDVGYVDDFTLTPDINEVFGFVAVVNTGAGPLDLSTAEVVTFLDDRDDVVWAFAREMGSETVLEPGRAGGYLTLAARSVVLANEVVTEPVDDETLSFSMSLETGALSDFTLQAQAVIAIGGVQATLPLTVRVVSGGEFQVNSARRIRSGK